MHIMALRFGDLAFASAFGCRSGTPCSAPKGAGAGLPPPRGNTGARPTNHDCPSGEASFVFVDLCDICHIDMGHCLGDSAPRLAAVALVPEMLQCQMQAAVITYRGVVIRSEKFREWACFGVRAPLGAPQ